MVDRTYTVLRSIRTLTEKREVAEAQGLTWEQAKAKCDELSAAERSAKPNETSWNRDIFYCQLEKQAVA